MSRRVGRRPRVVVDTGVVVSAFAFGGVPQRALEEVLRSDEVCVSPEPMAAYRTVPQALLAARKITAEQFRSLVAGITAFVSEARMLVPAGCQRSVAAFRKSGESLARMRHLIVLAPEAVEDLEALRAADRAERFGTLWSDGCAMNQRRPAEAGSRGCGACVARSTVSAWRMSESSATWSSNASKCWRSWRSRTRPPGSSATANRVLRRPENEGKDAR